ncbi:MAG: histidine phosphatase family protein [Desulfurobacteriaceae bacterium]
MGKRVFIVRHAKALKREEWEGDDCKRPLTREGIEEFKTFIKWLKPIFPKKVKVISSPCERALKTAEILSELLNVKVKVDERLKPDAEPDDYLSVIKENRGNLALIGHEPDISLFLNSITCISPAKLAFKKGAVAEVRKKGRNWEFYSIFNPKSFSSS